MDEDRFDKDTIRKVRQDIRRERISRSSAKESLDEFTNKYNATAKKYKEINKNIQDMKDSGSINAVEYRKLQNLKDQYYNELQQIKTSREQFSQKYFLGEENVDTLLLNAPREGAPMFEGLAVPSEYVNSNGDATESLENINKKYRATEQINANTDNTSLETFNRMISKNANKRFSKNHNFIFGNDYSNNENFKNAVNDFIDNNKDIYDSIYDKVINKVDVGTSEESARAFSNMLNLVSQKENLNINDLQNKMLENAGDNRGKLIDDFKANKEVFEHLDLDSSIWTIQNNEKEIPKTKQNKVLSQEERLRENALKKQKIIDNYKKSRENINKKLNKKIDKIEKQAEDYDIEPIEYTDIDAPDSPVYKQDTYKYQHPFERGDKRYRVKRDDPIEYTDLDAANSLIDIDDPEVAKKINELTKQEQIRFEENQRKEFTKRMNEIHNEYNRESIKINNKFTQKEMTSLTDFFTQEEIANFTNDNILEIAKNGDEYNEIINLRNKLRKDLGMEPILETNINTQQPEIKNNFRGGKNKNSQQQQAQEKQRQRAQEQNDKQYEEFSNTQQETKEETSQQHEDNTNTNKEHQGREVETETNKAKETKYYSNTSNEAEIKTRKQKLERTKGKKLLKGADKVTGKKFKVNKKIKGKDLNQILINTFVNSAVNATEESLETMNKTAKNWSRTDFTHPDNMSDAELANLTEEQFEQYKAYANGNQDKIDEWTQRRNKQIALDIENGTYSEPLYQDTRNPRTYRMRHTEYDVDENGDIILRKLDDINEVEIETNRRSLDNIKTKRRGGNGTMDDVFDWMKSHKIGMIDIGWNVISTIGDYKESRRQGRSVVSSAARAAGSFVFNEMIGFWGSLGLNIAKNAPKAIIKGAELLYKENRKMNSAANNQVFGNAQFYDTQQLATMRQSGMEMAKMAQYNLQQTLMGNEATYLHR